MRRIWHAFASIIPPARAVVKDKPVHIYPIVGQFVDPAMLEKMKVAGG